ncbi:STAS domain-containing protein [Parasphingorhabdus pacifica]
MTTITTPPKRVPTDAGPHSAASATSGITLRLSRPTSTSIVVHIAGELDGRTAPRLHELLAPRLSSTAESVILDLSGLRFLGVAGLELLAHTHRRAAGRAMTICIVDRPVCVDRALHAAGWSETVPTYVTVEAAIAELAGRLRESPVHAAG